MESGVVHITGAQKSKSRTHVSCGVKITDPDGVHPVSGAPLTLVEHDEDCSIYKFMQSRDLCTIQVIADACDSKELDNEVFRDFFMYAKELEAVGMPASNGQSALKPFLISFPQDIKSA